jgi:hypothetical protein
MLPPAQKRHRRQSRLRDRPKLGDGLAGFRDRDWFAAGSAIDHLTSLVSEIADADIGHKLSVSRVILPSPTDESEVAVPRTVVFFPEGAYAPTNNCVGIGDLLRRAGHRVVFVIEESFAGTLQAKGFEERLMRLGPKPEVEEEPGQFWKDFIAETAPVFRLPTIEQLEQFIAPTFQALLDGARYVDSA